MGFYKCKEKYIYMWIRYLFRRAVRKCGVTFGVSYVSQMNWEKKLSKQQKPCPSTHCHVPKPMWSLPYDNNRRRPTATCLLPQLDNHQVSYFIHDTRVKFKILPVIQDLNWNFHFKKICQVNFFGWRFGDREQEFQDDP